MYHTVDVDYTLSATSFTFAAGQTESFITVTVIQDAFAEQVESIQAVLTNPSDGLSIGGDSTATVTVTDNDGRFMSTSTVEPVYSSHPRDP